MTQLTKAHLRGIQKSFDVYYRDPDRTARMDRLNAQFVPQDGLAFDIGAHVGDRTGSFARLGATVVAAEPQPHIARALRLIYGKCERVHLHETAVGAETGTLDLHLNTMNPTVTTVSPALIAAAQTAGGWKDQVWDQTIRVPVTTLDALIARHGTPDFVKVDVEGHELEVFKGLTRCIPTLSFEFTTLQRQVALECLDYLENLCPYQFNVSLGEDHALIHSKWMTAPEMRAHIKQLPDRANSGDIFARLR